MSAAEILTTTATYLGDNAAVFYALVFAAVFLGVVGVFQLFAGPSASERRMVAGAVDLGLGAATGAPRGLDAGRFSAFVRPLSKFAPASETDTALRQRLVQAGYFDPDAVKTYYGIRVFLAALLPLTVVTIVPVLDPGAGAGRTVLMALGAGALGLYLPALAVSRRIRLRQRAVREGFPDALDMLVVCVEAGLGVDAAFARVGQQMWKPHPVVAQHFALVGTELRTGAERAEAIRRMAQRVGTDEIRSFATLVVQSELLGSSIAQTLRTYAYEMRQARVLRAEEKAHRLPVLLSIPLVTMILPCMITAVLLPAIINVIRVVVPALAG